jgi:hypothetical protein
LKRSYTGLAVSERFNYAFGSQITSLNLKSDAAVSRKPEVKKAIFLGGQLFIDQDISFLVNGLYGK